MKTEGAYVDVSHAKTKEAAHRKALSLINKGYRVEVRPVGKGTGAWVQGNRWIIEWYTSWKKRK